MQYTGLLAALMLLANPVNAEPGAGQAPFAKLRQAQSAELDRIVEQKLAVLMQQSLLAPAVDPAMSCNANTPRPIAASIAVQRLHLASLPAR